MIRTITFDPWQLAKTMALVMRKEEKVVYMDNGLTSPFKLKDIGLVKGGEYVSMLSSKDVQIRFVVLTGEPSVEPGQAVEMNPVIHFDWREDEPLYKIIVRRSQRRLHKLIAAITFWR